MKGYIVKNLMLFLVLIMSVVSVASLDCSTITLEEDYYYDGGMHYAFFLPVVSGLNSVLGPIDMRLIYYPDRSSMQVVFSQDGSSWSDYSGFPVFNSLPDYYVADSLSYVYAVSGERWRTAVDSSLAGGGMSGSLTFSAYPPSGSVVTVTAHLVVDSDDDGLLNYQDLDSNAYMSIPEPATLFILAGGAFAVFSRRKCQR